MTQAKKADRIKIERGEGGALVIRLDGIRIGQITGSVGRYYVKDRAGCPVGVASTIHEAIAKLTNR